MGANPSIPLSGQVPFDPAGPGTVAGTNQNSYSGASQPGPFGAQGTFPGALSNGSIGNLQQNPFPNPFQNSFQKSQTGGLLNGTAGDSGYTLASPGASTYPAPAVPGRPTGAYSVVDPKGDTNSVSNRNSPSGANSSLTLDRAAQTAQQQLANPVRANS